MGEKILLIEDDQDYIALLSRVLNQAGFTVSSLSSAKNLAQEFEKGLPDLIILDIMLPDISGFSVLEDIKKDSKTKHIPVICLTNLAADTGREKAMSLGAHSYLTKVHDDIYHIAKYIELYFSEQATKTNN